jgi:putative DNA methylase
VSTYRKKLIEVALPLDAINAASVREKSIRHGHPSTLHLWWARRPLATARAVIFAQMVDDPSSCPDLFPTEKDQEKERRRLFGIIEDLVKWENSNNEKVLQRAKDEIWNCWRRACVDNVDHPHAYELFNPDILPSFHDPFAGGGALPLEAQRLGLESHASDLNPVAVLINKALIEIPPKFADRPPVNPEACNEPTLLARNWRGAQGLAQDVRYYGRWLRDEAEQQIGHLYPKIEITGEMAQARPDLTPYLGQKLTVIAWLWARTVKSPNPAFKDVEVPLTSTFMLSTKLGKEAYVEPVIYNGSYRFDVKVGQPSDLAVTKKGTKLAGANFTCLMSGSPISGDYIKDEGNAGSIGARLMAIVAQGDRARVYLTPTSQYETVAQEAEPTWKPDGDIATRMTGGNCTPYGLTTWSNIFSDRQLVALSTFSGLVDIVREHIKNDVVSSWQCDEGKSLRDGGNGAIAYSEAVATYLGLTVGRQANRGSTISFWDNTSQKIQQAFGRQALPMTWDFCESNPFSESSGNWMGQLEFPAKCLDNSITQVSGYVRQEDAQRQTVSNGKLISTDPPYYDNIGYADLSDFFYVWLRRSLQKVYPNLFATLAVPKVEELVASPHRHGGKEKAEKFFLDGMTHAMHRLSEQAHPAFPVTIYYAYKQSEKKSDKGATSTGWDTFLDAVIRAGFTITGTWPMRTELTGNLKKGVAALASSIVLVCRHREAKAPTVTRREFVNALTAEFPEALVHLQAGNIAPVDLAQAAIGPGMAIYTRYERIVDAEGKELSVGVALGLINQILDETLSEQEGDLDPDSRWALAWFEQLGFAEGEFGIAEQLSLSKVTSVSGLAEAGIIKRMGGKVRLLKPEELPTAWDPELDTRQTIWEATHHLIKMHDNQGDQATASLLAKLGSAAEQGKNLAYRLYVICERKGWVEAAIAYNGLVLAWPELERLAGETIDQTSQGELFQ